MTLLFILAIRELGSSLFLYTSNTMVMAVLLLDYYEGGNIGITAAFSLVQTVLLGRRDRHRASALARRDRQRTAGPRRIRDCNHGRREGMACNDARTRRSSARRGGPRWRGASAPAAAQNFGPPELIEAAKKEGKLIYYTANFTEVEQETIKAFNKRFPFVRDRAGARARRPAHHARAHRGRRRQAAADVIDHSDRGLMQRAADLFQDYAPPNAADYRDDVLISPKLWPRITLGLVDRLQLRAGEEPAEILDGPDQAGIRQQADRQVFAPSGGTTWTRVDVRAPSAGRGLLEEAGGRRSRCSTLRARRSPTRWCAARSRSRRCSTTSCYARSATARRSRFSSRPKACR